MRPLILLVLAACTACLGSDFADSLEGQWQLVAGTVDGEEIDILEAHPVTILFEGDQAGGTAACNHYGGTFEISGSGISFGDMAVTEMACFPEEVMDLERTYLEALSRVRSVILDEQLTLRGPEVELTFEALAPVPDADLTDTRWLLDGLIRGDAVSTVMGEPATLELTGDGRLEGGTGCRTFSGRYEIRGGEVVVTEIASDGHECEPDLADQDAQVLSVIGDMFRVDISGGALTVTTPGGDLGLVYRATD